MQAFMPWISNGARKKESSTQNNTNTSEERAWYAHQKQPFKLKVCTASQHISFCLSVSMLFGAVYDAQWNSLCDSVVHSSRLCSDRSTGCGATRADAKDKATSSRRAQVLHCSLIPAAPKMSPFLKAPSRKHLKGERQLCTVAHQYQRNVKPHRKALVRRS